MLAIAAAATFFMTTIMAMAGVGAAFILVPIFVALGIDIHVAMATALLLNAISTGVSTFTFIRKGLVEWRLALPIVLVAVLFSPIGVQVSQGLERQLLLWLFSAFLVFASLMMLFYAPKPSPVAQPPQPDPARVAAGGDRRFCGRTSGHRGWQHHSACAGWIRR